MKTIVRRLWNEPAVVIGLAVSAALGAVNAGEPWTAQTVAEVAAPFVSSLGIRQFVTPSRGADGNG